MDNPRLLLPGYFRIIGIVLALAGTVMTVIRFIAGIIPGFLETRVFAVYSSYLETHEFSVITNNISEEICGVTLLLGLFFTAFAKLKNESEIIWKLRSRAFFYTFYINTFFLIFCVLFIYGWGFLLVMTLNLILYLLLYNICFYVLVARNTGEPDDTF